jgi:hypothetical protein
MASCNSMLSVPPVASNDRPSQPSTSPIPVKSPLNGLAGEMPADARVKEPVLQGVDLSLALVDNSADGISAKTVNHHVSAVLAKLGVENREAAAEMSRNLTA